MSNDQTPGQTPATDFEFVAPGALSYIVTTGDWIFSAADSVFEKPAEKIYSTVTDGPYSSYARAEMAADLRLKGVVASGLVTHGQMKQHAIGGPRGPHGMACSWVRDLVYRDLSGQFGDQEGWQEIQVVTVDKLP